jgi:exodeoxyribonuclease V gamma subunit
MKQWLSGALARKRGSSSIVANLEIQLPSAWLDTCTKEFLGEAAVALEEYRSERLRWRIHGLLPDISDAGVASCLQGETSSLRRYQLADRLAKIFTQYVMYRPDWLAAWQRGREAARNAGFQPELWRRLRDQIALPHRGELLEMLIDRLQSGNVNIPQDPLHVFGISHLAPAEMRLLTAFARGRPIFLYVPDPCAHYWADTIARSIRHPHLIGMPASAARRKELASAAVFEATSESLFIDEVGHPLLASWGRMGQHFMLGLEASNVAMDVRHWEDEVALSSSRPQPLLARVQASIRELDPSLPTRSPGACGNEDSSLRIHSCHTRLRELELLRDALLAARSELPDLRPADIIVMAPNIGAYVPLLGAVFGPPGNAKVDLPYHMADVSVARVHPIFGAFSQLLSLPQSRISAPEVLDLLRIPQVAAALGIDPGGVDTLRHWLERAGIAWGLDGAFRADQFGLPPTQEFSFAWGVERLLAGYAFGQEVPGRALELPGTENENGMRRLWPVEGIEGPQAALVGALDNLLLVLATLHRDTATTRRASAWSVRLLGLVDELFRIDRRDREARAALASLRGVIETLATETEAAGDPELSFEVVREVLRERLSTVSERQHLLMGGITFCGMVPERAIPFRIVAVLGLNDGEFPRQLNGAGLDLSLQPGNRRIGDRDVRNDDRYLFLETLMSARDRLHLSYIGEGVRDGKPRNPAAPLAELMAFLDSGTAAEGTSLHEDERRAADAGDVGESAPAQLRPWRVSHPLQPFDARYYNSDTRLFSFDAMLADIRIGSDRPPPFIAERVPAGLHFEEMEVPLGSVIAWFKDPAKQVLTSALQLRLDALEEGALAADERLEPTVSALDRIPRRLVLDALLSAPMAREIPADPPDWLKLDGKLPAGRLGELAWTGEKGARAKATRLLDSLPAGLLAVPLARSPQTVAWRGNSTTVVGEVHDVVKSEEDGTVWVFDAHAKGEDKLDFKQRVPLFLQWALLRLQTPDATEVRICLLVEDGVKNPKRDWRDAFTAWCDLFANEPSERSELRAELNQRVQQILGVYISAQEGTVWYFPATSWAGRADDCVEAVMNAWAGDGRKMGEGRYSPGYAGLFARGMDLEQGPSQDVMRDLQRTARLLDQAIHLGRPLGSVDPPKVPLETGA